ncbi:MAG: cyclic nucleotide-binding domain-containing protein [Rhizobacter sp.]|nr:cyclic nucleotide-binding domain-containing protein [Chlorobiales bacterium]
MIHSPPMVELDFLKHVPIFKGLPGPSLLELQSIITEESYPRGTDIIKDGDKGESMFVLLDGEVSISKNLTMLPSDTDRKDKVLFRMSSESFAVFGEMALFEKISERTATVTATRDCKVGVIQKQDFLAIATRSHELGYIVFRNISEILSERLKKANKDILKLTTALSLALDE